MTWRPLAAPPPPGLQMMRFAQPSGKVASAPVSTPATDPYFANTKLLLHLDGANGSTTFTDSSGGGNTITRAGSATLTTAQSRFGGSSLGLDGSGSYLQLANTAGLQLHSGDYTVEMFVRFDVAPTGKAIFTSAYASSHIPLAVFFSTAIGTDTAGSNLNVGYFIQGSGWFGISTQWAPSLGVWYHISAERSGNAMFAFVDGALKGAPFLIGTQPQSSTQPLYIGRRWDTGVSPYAIAGQIDEVRVTKGIARHVGFTPPTSEFPNS